MKKHSTQLRAPKISYLQKNQMRIRMKALRTSCNCDSDSSRVTQCCESAPLSESQNLSPGSIVLRKGCDRLDLIRTISRHQSPQSPCSDICWCGFSSSCRC